MASGAAIEDPAGRARGERAEDEVRGRDLPDALRVGYVTAVVLALLDHAWFVDLSDRSLIDGIEGGSLATQLLFAVLALVALPLLRHLGVWRLRPLASPSLLLLGAWLGISTLLSTDVAISVRRIALYVIVAMLAASLLVVARTARQLAAGLGLAAAIVLAASYGGVLLLPGLSIHSNYDLLDEASHTGLWRGIFPHKNEAGVAMSVILVCGLYVAAVRNRWAGWAIAAAAAVFLAFTGSRTPVLALGLALSASWAVRAVRWRPLRLAILVGPAALMALVTVGAVLIPAVRHATEAVLPDATFTARNEIWAFAVDNAMKHPVTGWGFGAFWLTDATVYGGSADPNSNWVQTATQAHNAFLDAALIMGLPGLILVLTAFVLAPARDVLRASAGRAPDLAADLFLRLWQIALLSASFENVLFNPNSAACGMALLGVFGLRMCAARPVIA